MIPDVSPDRRICNGYARFQFIHHATLVDVRGTLSVNQLAERITWLDFAEKSTKVDYCHECVSFRFTKLTAMAGGVTHTCIFSIHLGINGVDNHYSHILNGCDRLNYSTAHVSCVRPQ
jgi:hypothetical protein